VSCGNNALKAALSQGRIADLFIEKTPAITFYALAVLDRQACMNQLMPLVHTQDNQTKELISRFKKTDLSTHPPDSFALMDAFLCREALDAALAAAMPAGKGLPPTVQPKTVGRLFRK
jgi:hypothetical protein